MANRKEFPKVSALSLHKGRTGNNEIDQAATDKLIIDLVNARAANGLVYTRLETTEVASGGAKRKVRSVIEMEMA